jgi:hypothetical protein
MQVPDRQEGEGGEGREVAIQRPAPPRKDSAKDFSWMDTAEAYLAQGGGIRPTAKNIGVSPGTIINARRSMQVGRDRPAA